MAIDVVAVICYLKGGRWGSDDCRTTAEAAAVYPVGEASDSSCALCWPLLLLQYPESPYPLPLLYISSSPTSSSSHFLLGSKEKGPHAAHSAAQTNAVLSIRSATGMALDKSRISILSSTKVDGDKLSSVGDTMESLVPASRRLQLEEERCCPLCCVTYGALISSAAVFCIAASGTAVSIFAESRVNYTVNGAMRQTAWIAFPGVLVGATLHYFMAEAMWSSKRNSWGQAWTKAIVANAGLWTTAICLGTLAWRKGLPLTSAGRRLYHRYPIPSEPLEVRLLRISREFFTGMGATYWLSGVASGHLGFVTCVSFCVSANRPYFMMAPHGGYAHRCMPPWRRQQLHAMALGGASTEQLTVAQQQERTPKKPSIK